jgi:hypothetical protein
MLTETHHQPRTRKPGAGRKPKAGVPVSEKRNWRFTKTQVQLLDSIVAQMGMVDPRQYLLEKVLVDAEEYPEHAELISRVKNEFAAQFGPDPRSKCTQCKQIGALQKTVKNKLHFRCPDGHLWAFEIK